MGMENRMESIEEDIKDIKDNHLNSIVQRLSKLEGKQTILIGIAMVILGCVIAAIFV